MPGIENFNPIILVAAFTGLLSIYFLLSLLFRIGKLKLLSAIKTLFGLVFFATLTLVISVLMVGTQGYQALTKEEAVATLQVSPSGEQAFLARMQFNDGSHQVFAIKGDELMIDAYVIKWKPWVNLLGLHSAYRLDRIQGRYQMIEDEKNKPRSIYGFNGDSGSNLPQWHKDYAVLSWFLDVEQGSASFTKVEEDGQFQLFVTTSGLLIRPVISENSLEE